jgi:hypothetical protein
MNINLEDITIIPDLDSIVRLNISDEEYFGPEYADYTSNSRLKLINPEKGGSPLNYKNGFKIKNDRSLILGSCVHELFLQKDEFVLAPDLKKPTAKLGLVIDKIKEYRERGCKIIDSINMACHDVDYYKNSISNSKISKIISEGLYYYLHMPTDKNVVVLPTKARETCINCVKNLESNRQIINLINPKDIFGDPIESYNEDAFFINFNCQHENKSCVIKFKMKADNWSIDKDDKKLTLNDLKTTSSDVSEFMGINFFKFNYYTQFYIYLYILSEYCKQQYNFDDTWTTDCNVIVVGTRGNNETAVYKVFDILLEEGKREFYRLLKMVAYCEMYGYNDDYIFM